MSVGSKAESMAGSRVGKKARLTAANSAERKVAGKAEMMVELMVARSDDYLAVD